MLITKTSNRRKKIEHVIDYIGEVCLKSFNFLEESWFMRRNNLWLFKKYTVDPVHPPMGRRRLKIPGGMMMLVKTRSTGRKVRSRTGKISKILLSLSAAFRNSQFCKRWMIQFLFCPEQPAQNISKHLNICRNVNII